MIVNDIREKGAKWVEGDGGTGQPHGVIRLTVLTVRRRSVAIWSSWCGAEPACNAGRVSSVLFRFCVLLLFERATFPLIALRP